MGANDVANNFGTSVGSKSITLKKALVIAAVFELLGSVLLGGSVTDSVRTGIYARNSFNNYITEHGYAYGADDFLLIANLVVLATVTVWLFTASSLRMSVSTTHSIIGSYIGCGLALNNSVVNWSYLATVVVSWVVAPLIASVLGAVFFVCVRHLILRADYTIGLRNARVLMAVLLYYVCALVTILLLFSNPVSANRECKQTRDGETIIERPCVLSYWAKAHKLIAVAIALGVAVILFGICYFPMRLWVNSQLADLEKARKVKLALRKSKTLDLDDSEQHQRRSSSLLTENGMEISGPAPSAHPGGSLPPGAVITVLDTGPHTNPHTEHQQRGVELVRRDDSIATLPAGLHLGAELDGCLAVESSEGGESVGYHHASTTLPVTSHPHGYEVSVLPRLHLPDAELDPKDAAGADVGCRGSLYLPWNRDLFTEAKNASAKVQEFDRFSERFPAQSETFFKALQTVSAALACLVHGSNDVGNAAAPFASVYSIWKEKEFKAHIPVPIWILLLGGVGISLGLIVLGYKVIRTVGIELVHLNASKGFCVEMAVFTVIIICSFCGITISSTHIFIGAMIGVGLMDRYIEPETGQDITPVKGRFFNVQAVNWKLAGKLAISWVGTIVLTSLMAFAIFSFATHSPSVY